MSKAFGTFVTSSIISYVVLLGGLILWTQAVEVTRPSDADGLGFAIAYGVVWLVPAALIVGFFISLIRWLNEDPDSADKNFEE
ncbi:hypothetical protein ACFQPF_05265 [Fictibacillus iocasae]|uniref:DUF997 domain-containing protein n=1 Tax=Fictibacillus iocasae TaxID=2715437 RepID=A0ABW2NPH2_9BACL